MTTHAVGGELVETPVEIRSASACSALFAVPAPAAATLLAGAGLEPVRPWPGRALCSLAFVRYIDGDLGPYHEFAVALLARAPGSARAGAYIHRLPVDGEFTLAAGRGIWGFPKELTTIDLRLSGGTRRCVVRRPDGRFVLGMTVRTGLPVPSAAGGTDVDAYSLHEGVLRRTPWEMRPGRVRAGLGGARMVLGDDPIADELRTLGLPRRALTTTTIGALGMTFGDAEELS